MVRISAVGLNHAKTLAKLLDQDFTFCWPCIT
jgi:hypothetical protein